VGYLETELPIDEPRVFSHIKRGNRPALQLDTVLFFVYYPTDPVQATSHRREPWLPRPRVPTCKGYAKFSSIPEFPVTTYIACTCMFTTLPEFRNPKLAGARPPGAGAAAPKKPSDDLKPKVPVVVFSHGLGVSRTTCSTICGDLASHGFAVVTMEHRAGSGARSHVNAPETSNSPQLIRDEGMRVSGSELKHATNGRRNNKPKGSRNYTVDCIFPKAIAQDTAPHNPRGADHELREAQIGLGTKI
jgi:platelet-activating factor acetylhydrolase